MSSRRRSARWDCQRDARPSTAALVSSAGPGWGMFTIPSVSGTLGIGNRFDRRRQPMPVNGQSDPGQPGPGQSVPGPQEPAAAASSAQSPMGGDATGAAAAPRLRRAVVVGGNRIPFARTGGAYTKSSNQDMLTAALEGLIARFGLQD